jgi:hypothetical protein
MPAYTWSTGETITATLLNNLETEAWRVANAVSYDDSTALFTTTSAAYVDVTGLSVSFTAKATTAVISVNHNFYHSSSNQVSLFAVRVNSVDYLVASSNHYPGTGTTYASSVCGFVQVTGLTVGVSYTAQARVATTGTNTLTIERYVSGGTGVASRGAVVVFDVTK